MYMCAGFQGVQFHRRKNKNVSHFLVFKKKKRSDTHKHPTCLELNEEEIHPATFRVVCIVLRR